MSTLYLRVLEKWINANFRLPSAAISSVKRGGLPQFLLSWLETGLQGLILPGQRRAVLSGVQRLPRLLRSTGLERGSCCAGSAFRLLLKISAAKAAAPFPVKAACAFFDSLQSRSSFKLNSLPSAETAAAGPFGAEAPAPTAAETAAASPSGAEAPAPTAAEDAAPDCLVRIGEGVSFSCCAGTWDLPFLKTTRRLYIAGPAVNTRLYSAVSHSFRELVRLIDRRR